MKFKKHVKIILLLFVIYAPLWLALFFKIFFASKIQYFTNPNVNENLLFNVNNIIVNATVSLLIVILFYLFMYLYWEKLKLYLLDNNSFLFYMATPINLTFLIIDYGMSIPIFLNTINFFQPSKSTFLFTDYFELVDKYSKTMDYIFLLSLILIPGCLVLYENNKKKESQ